MAALALSLTEEWLLLTVGRIIEKKVNKFECQKKSTGALGSKCIKDYAEINILRILYMYFWHPV